MREFCKSFLGLKGIIYPKWIKNRNQSGENSKTTWSIQKYIYSFSRHCSYDKLKAVTSLELKNHVQSCPFKILKFYENNPVKVFPPYLMTEKTCDRNKNY